MKVQRQVTTSWTTTASAVADDCPTHRLKCAPDPARERAEVDIRGEQGVQKITNSGVTCPSGSAASDCGPPTLENWLGDVAYSEASASTKSPGVRGGYPRRRRMGGSPKLERRRVAAERALLLPPRSDLVDQSPAPPPLEQCGTSPEAPSAQRPGNNAPFRQPAVYKRRCDSDNWLAMVI